MFEHDPYVKCPRCKKQSLGILSIYSDRYHRRCESCSYAPEAIPLPPLNKKVIYLDQMAISNMMKATNVADKAHQRATKDPFWQALHRKLSRGFSLQLLVCPESDFHLEESLLTPYQKNLEGMYRMFSGNVRYIDHETIHHFQLNQQMDKWLGVTREPITRKNVIDGKINEWLDVITPAIQMDFSTERDEVIRNRNAVNREMEKVWAQWRADTGKDFWFWFNEEVVGYARMVVKKSVAHRKRVLMACAGMPVRPEDLYPNYGTIVLHDLREKLKEHTDDPDEVDGRLRAFFESSEFKDTPHITIGAMLNAAMARRAARGRKRPPDMGFYIDTNMISTVMPYCDVMFIDDECHGLLEEQPLASELKYRVMVYSNKTRDLFLKYLDALPAAMSPEHIEAVKAVYGSRILPDE